MSTTLQLWQGPSGPLVPSSGKGLALLGQAYPPRQRANVPNRNRIRGTDRFLSSISHRGNEAPGPSSKGASVSGRSIDTFSVSIPRFRRVPNAPSFPSAPHVGVRISKHSAMAATESKAGAKAKEKKDKPKASKNGRNDPLWLVLLPILGVLVVGLGPTLYSYGWRILVPTGLKTLELDADTWMNDVLPSRTFVFVAGHHRGGTTLLWEILREHPDIGAFGSQQDTGVDKSEGVFLQDLLPAFGVGAETTWLHRIGASKKVMKGVGTYAIPGYDAVAWNEVNQREKVTLPNLVQLLNQWGYFWKTSGGWSKHYWIEKTPTNAVLSRFIQALFDQKLDVEQGINNPEVPWPVPRESRTKFVFMMRHPLANALAHKKWGNAKHLKLETLIQNWLSISAIMTEDCKHLKNCLFVRLEDLALNPDQEVSRIVTFLGLSDFNWSTQVYPDPNAKYAAEYCKAQAGLGGESSRAILDHFMLVQKYGQQVKQFGYSLEEWPCLADAHKLLAQKMSKLAEQEKQKEEL